MNKHIHVNEVLSAMRLSVVGIEIEWINPTTREKYYSIVDLRETGNTAHNEMLLQVEASSKQSNGLRYYGYKMLYEGDL